MAVGKRDNRILVRKLTTLSKLPEPDFPLVDLKEDPGDWVFIYFSFVAVYFDKLVAGSVAGIDAISPHPNNPGVVDQEHQHMRMHTQLNHKLIKATPHPLLHLWIAVLKLVDTCVLIPVRGTMFEAALVAVSENFFAPWFEQFFLARTNGRSIVDAVCRWHCHEELEHHDQSVSASFGQVGMLGRLLMIPAYLFVVLLGVLFFTFPALTALTTSSPLKSIPAALRMLGPDFLYFQVCLLIFVVRLSAGLPSKGHSEIEKMLDQSEAMFKSKYSVSLSNSALKDDFPLWTVRRSSR